MAEKPFFNAEIFELKRRKKVVQGRLHQLKTAVQAQRKDDALASEEDTVGVVASFTRRGSGP